MQLANWIQKEYDQNKINKEKIDVIKDDGNILVTANPGTGKTLLLMYKYLNLLHNNVKPSDILCLTFTTKAKKELEDRILKNIREKNIDVDISDVKVHTFHSFALENGGEEDVVSSNLLRYAIYEYFKKEEVFTYGDWYLLNTIVPKMENLIRYIKSYGILPKDINTEEAKKLLEGDMKNSKEEIDKFAEHFVETYKYYEKIRSSRGIDYSDMLLNFLNLREIPQYKYVLVDEMQDVNQIEAKIALKTSQNFVCVGDKKQAIMGFQGGSVSNLKLFENSKHHILSDNFRSGQEILDYAKDKFDSKDESNVEELKDLRNAKDEHSPKPKIYCVDKDDVFSSASELAKNLSSDGSQVAIIARTNNQISQVTKELEARNLDYASTYFSASSDAKQEIITFLKGILSNDPDDIRNSLFSPFFPIRIQDAFKLSGLKKEELLENCPKLKEMREEVKNLRDVDVLFEKYIIPFSVAYGGGYLLASLSVQQSYQEALRHLDNMDYKPLIDFIFSSDLLNQSVDTQNKIIVTTVHKAKGLQYDTVIYLPKKPQDNSNFQDRVVTSILSTKGVDVKEELLEESLRIDFVAFTRAKKELHVMTPESETYLSNVAEVENPPQGEEVASDLQERSKKAFSLFVSGDYENAKKYLEERDVWFFPFVKDHFENLDHISFTKLNKKPFEYLKNNILRLEETSFALELGSEVHNYAEHILRGEEFDVNYQQYYENIRSLIENIQETYPNVEMIEEAFRYTLRDLFGIDSDFKFSGMLDAVFSNGEEYLIVDWKTSKNQDSSHRQQLVAYKKALSLMKNIPEERIKVAIGYVGLRPRINLGRLDKYLDDKQPPSTTINSLIKKINTILSWKNDPLKFLKDFMNDKTYDDKIWKALCEQIKREELL